MMMLIIAMVATLSTGCVGLDPNNEGFGDNAGEVARRTLVGVMTLGISEGFLADERKRQRLQHAQAAQYRQWYDGLSDTEKNIEDMKEAHRYQLMGTIMMNRPAANYQLPTVRPYAPPVYPQADGLVQPRQRTNCTSRVVGNQVYTDCY